MVPLNHMSNSCVGVGDAGFCPFEKSHVQLLYHLVQSNNSCHKETFVSTLNLKIFTPSWNNKEFQHNHQVGHHLYCYSAFLRAIN